MNKKNNVIFSIQSWRLTKPDFMEEAARQRKGFPILVEIIKFYILYFLALVVMPNVYIHLLTISGVDVNIFFQSDFLFQILNCTLVALSAVIFIPAYLLIDRRSISTLGFVRKNMGKELLKGCALGFVSFSACVLLAVLLGAAHFEQFNHSTFWTAFIFLPIYFFQGSAEEIMCRGYLMVNLSVRTHLWIAVIINGLSFALIHLMNPGASFLMILNITIVGILFSVIVIKTGSIWCACGFHALWNFTQGCVYGLPVSGSNTDSSSTLFQFSLSEGKPLLTGGIFGLEASLISFIVLMLVFLAFIYLYPDKQNEK